MDSRRIVRVITRVVLYRGSAPVNVVKLCRSLSESTSVDSDKLSKHNQINRRCTTRCERAMMRTKLGPDSAIKRAKPLFDLSDDDNERRPQTFAATSSQRKGKGVDDSKAAPGVTPFSADEIFLGVSKLQVAESSGNIPVRSLSDSGDLVVLGCFDSELNDVADLATEIAQQTVQESDLTEASSWESNLRTSSIDVEREYVGVSASHLFLVLIGSLPAALEISCRQHRTLKMCARQTSLQNAVRRRHRCRRLRIVRIPSPQRCVLLS